MQVDAQTANRLVGGPGRWRAKFVAFLRLSIDACTRATLDHDVLAIARHRDFEDAREARDYWHARARSLPRRRIAARREAFAMARRWDRRLEEQARRALFIAPLPALRALVDVRRARAARGLRRVATLGLGAVFAAGVAAALAAEALWHVLRSLG
jgi:hypothetical protein